MPERGEEDVVDHEGRELAHDDGQLVAARDRPADLERRQLRQVDRHHRRCAADREPENDPAGHQEPETGREDDDQHAHEEHDREHDDRGAASDGVGDLSAEQGSDAAAKTSELIATPNCNREPESSACIGPSAPLDTPVS